jgi:hypothetical protein
MSHSKTFGGVIVIFTIAISFYLAGDLRLLFDIPSLGYMFFMIVGGLLQSVGLKGLLEIPKRDQYYREEVKKRGRQISLLAGAMGFFTGLLIILANLSDLNALGPALSVSLLTVFYSMAINITIFSKSNTFHKKPLENGSKYKDVA